MVASDIASVKFSRLRGDIAHDGFDRDISFNDPDRPLIRMPAGTGAVIDLWSDTDSRAEGRGLASRGDTFAASTNTSVSIGKENSRKIEKKDSALSTPEGTKPRTFETRRRYDLKHAIVRMLRTDLEEDERSHAVCGCGLAALDRGEEDGVRLHIPVHRNDVNRAWVSGVYRCKSGWLCPTCAPAVAQKRQEAVQDVVRATADVNGVFLMGLVTISHTMTDKLHAVKKIVTESFAAARRQKNWERAKKAAGVAGVLVAPEVTYGKHGWHFHLHFGISCLPCLPCDDENDNDNDEMTDAESEDLEDAALAAGRILIANFRAQVAKRGGTTVDDGQGIQIAVSPEAASDYIAKGTSWELAGGNVHKNEVKGQTIWEIVEDADAGDVNAYARFREYAETMPGTRSCIITTKLRENLDLPADVENDGAEQQFEDGGRIVGHLETFTWHRFLRAKLAGTFLSRIESVSGNVTPAVFERLVIETAADACKAENIITLKRARKIQTSADDVAAGNAATKVMLTRNIAYRVRAAQALGNVHEIIGTRIEAFRSEGHPEAALPTPSDVVTEIARLDHDASERAMAA